MPSLDVVIVAVYLFTLVYIAYRAIDSLEDQAVVYLDQATLRAQLEEADLQDRLAIKVLLKGRYRFEPIPDLSLMITNASEFPIYVDWDRSTLTNFAGRSRRVVRVTPSMNFDLSQPQIFSVIAPGKVLSERIVAEDMLKRTPEGIMQVASPLVDLAPVQMLPEDKQLEFALRLVVRIVEPGRELDHDMVTYSVVCRFIAQRVPWDAGYPWKRKKET